MTMSLSIQELCREFFDAVERSDHETLVSLIAWGAVRSQNGGPDTPLATAADPSVRQAMAERFGQIRYEDIRHVIGVDSVAEQHRVRSSRPDGTVIDADVCIVMRFDEHRLIVRLDEYFDPRDFS